MESICNLCKILESKKLNKMNLQVLKRESSAVDSKKKRILKSCGIIEDLTNAKGKTYVNISEHDAASHKGIAKSQNSLIDHGKAESCVNIGIQNRPELVVLAIHDQSNYINLKKFISTGLFLKCLVIMFHDVFCLIYKYVVNLCIDPKKKFYKLISHSASYSCTTEFTPS